MDPHVSVPMEKPTSPAAVAEAEPAEDPLGYVVGDSTRLRSLGWRPEYDLRRGLEAMVRAMS